VARIEKPSGNRTFAAGASLTGTSSRSGPTAGSKKPRSHCTLRRSGESPHLPHSDRWSLLGQKIALFTNGPQSNFVAAEEFALPLVKRRLLIDLAAIRNCGWLLRVEAVWKRAVLPMYKSYCPKLSCADNKFGK
jgi:hypothetical protein